jgi:hypothetical protein
MNEPFNDKFKLDFQYILLPGELAGVSTAFLVSKNTTYMMTVMP